MSKSVPVDESTFDQTVLKADRPVLVDFWATWCKPCVMIAPILDELADEYNGRISFVRMDIEENPKTAAKYRVMSLPTLIIFKNGEPVSNIVGLKPKADLKRNLEASLA